METWQVRLYRRGPHGEPEEIEILSEDISISHMACFAAGYIKALDRYGPGAPLSAAERGVFVTPNGRTWVVDVVKKEE